MIQLKRIAYFLLGVLPLVTIGFDINHGNYNLINYFSLFTILSNLLAGLVFLYLAFNTYKKIGVDSFRGATLSYLLFSSAVYYLLLKNIAVPPAFPWINTVFHQIMPITVFLTWIIFPPKRDLRFKDSLKWFVFPIIYAFYLIFRGRIVNWNPYPFLDSTTKGFGTVFINVIISAIFGLLLANILIIIGNKLNDFQKVFKD